MALVSIQERLILRLAGHLDVIQRALHVVDRLVIGVAVNAGKEPMFLLDERVEMVEEAIAGLELTTLRHVLRSGRSKAF